MPLSNPTTNNHYTINELIIKPEAKQIYMKISNIELNSSNNFSPTVKESIIFISDNPQDMILDPNYKPTIDFSYQDPATWGSIDPSSFPKILNQNTQYFTKITSVITSGGSLIAEVTTASLLALKSNLGLSNDWIVT